MADQKVNIVLTIDGSGALTKATANVGKLEKELDKTSKAIIKLKSLLMGIINKKKHFINLIYLLQKVFQK